MKKLSFVSLLILLVTITSCFNRKADNSNYISYVNDILKDTSSLGYHILHSYDPNDKYASITVVGDPEETLPIVNELMISDRFNNISGSKSKDQLPDFAGETISCLLDVVNAPYSGYIQKSNIDFFRELVVKTFIAAMDTNYLFSPFDKNLIESKKGAKLVILGSSYASLYGGPDVDTLCNASQVKVPVISPINAMFDYIASNSIITNNLCIWTTDDKVETNLYTEAYKLYDNNNLSPRPKLLIYNPDKYIPQAQRFIDILDLYLNAGNTEKLSYMIVDDANVNMDELKSFVYELKNSKDESQLAYKNIIADDFEFIYPAQSIAVECYKYLRRTNNFSHIIANPYFEGYLTCVATDLPIHSYSDDGGFTDDFKYSRAYGMDDDTWFVIAMRERFVSEELRNMIMKLSPKIENEYVR